MYNEEQKSAFLSEFQESESTQKLIKNIFNLLESFELKYGKDFCQFNQSELEESIPNVAGVRFESAEVVLSHLRRYVKWCSSHGQQIDESIYSYEIDMSGKVRSCFVRSPEHLLNVLDKVFGNTQNNSIEYIYRTYCWLAYFGFNEKEAAHVMADDVSFDEMCIRYGEDKRLSRQIYEESVDDLRKACTLDSFYEVKRTLRKVDRAFGSELLRGKATSKSMEEALATTFRQSVSKAFRDTKEKLEQETSVHPDLDSINLSFKRILLSGMFYRAHQKEGRGEPVDFDVIVDERYERGKSKYTHADNQAQKMKYHMKRGYFEDYENWKRAFEL